MMFVQSDAVCSCILQTHLPSMHVGRFDQPRRIMEETGRFGGWRDGQIVEESGTVVSLLVVLVT